MQFLLINKYLISKNFHWTLLLIGLITIQSGCKKLLKIDPPSESTTGDIVFSNTVSAMEALTGIYASIREDRLIAGDNGITIGSAMLSDEVQRREFAEFDDFYSNNLDAGYDFIWSCYRTYMFQLNSIIEGVSASRSIPQGAKDILLGEAKFLRAYIYFYLVNYYGDVPLVLTTSLEKNRDIGRTPQAIVYEQIVKDLIESQTTLSDNFLNPDLVSTSIERIRPNKGAATALLARVYLFTEQWDKAEIEATKVIADERYILDTANINDVFLKNSTEAIWQLQPKIWEGGESYTPDGGTFIPYPSGNFPNFIITPFLKSAFEDGDLRYINWTNSVVFDANTYVYPYKYKQNIDPQPQTEYIMVLRLAEQYLIRAEARANLGQLTGPNGAEADLNIIRSRAGLPNATVSTQREMIDAILQERQVELFTEGGHRWLDIKRTGKIDEIMNVICPLKGGEWQSFKALLPIPANEFEFNPSLRRHQNPGYSEKL